MSLPHSGHVPSVIVFHVRIIEGTNAGTPLQMTRYTQRFIPVDILCKVKLFDDFKKFAEPVIYKHFLHPYIVETRTAWCLEYKARGNEKCQRQDYYDYIKS